MDEKEDEIAKLFAQFFMSSTEDAAARHGFDERSFRQRIIEIIVCEMGEMRKAAHEKNDSN